jgi:heme oxygenase
LQSPARFDLRAATREPHRRLDSGLSRLRLDLREDYMRFLSIHARVIPALERSVESGRPWSGWSARAHFLQEDLLALGVATPTLDEPHEPVKEAECWGLQYVLEGSKLGGEVLSKRVASNLPQRYLNAGHEKGGWSRFQAELQIAAKEGGADWAELAANAARSGFERFETALKIEFGTVLGP